MDSSKSRFRENGVPKKSPLVMAPSNSLKEPLQSMAPSSVSIVKDSASALRNAAETEGSLIAIFCGVAIAT